MKRAVTAILAVLLFILPAFAAAPGRSQVILRATDEDGWVFSDVSLGSYAADTIRQAAGTDFAFLPSGLFGLNLSSGVVDEAALEASLPQDETIFVVSLTPVQLKEILEVSCSRLVMTEEETLDREASKWDGFLQMSGLHVIYNVPGLVGNRVYEVQLDDGSELDLSDTAAVYTAAVPASLLDGTYGYPAHSAQSEVGTLRDLVARRIAGEGVAEEPGDRRIILYGVHENNIIDALPPALIIFAILIFVFFGGHKWRRAFRFER